MGEDDMTERITEALRRGIRETIEGGDAQAFKRAALEAYRIRTGGRTLAEDDIIVQHVFPSDVEQTVRLSLHIRDRDREKAATLLKGALDTVLGRLSAVAQERGQPQTKEPGGSPGARSGAGGRGDPADKGLERGRRRWWRRE